MSAVGCRKPESEIDVLTTSLMGDPPERILYLGDFHANVVGAEAAGWRTIRVTGSLATCKGGPLDVPPRVCTSVLKRRAM